MDLVDTPVEEQIMECVNANVIIKIIGYHARSVGASEKHLKQASTEYERLHRLTISRLNRRQEREQRDRSSAQQNGSSKKQSGTNVA